MSDITFVVVVSLEAPDVIERCLQELSETGRPVVVVDNASTDKRARVAGRFSQMSVIRLAENRGYGGAANVGIERASANDVVLLNADAWPAPDGLDRLMRCARTRPRAGILGPRLVDTGGTPQPSSSGFPTRWWTGLSAVSSWPERARRHAIGRAKQPFRGFVVGAALFLRRAAIDEVGVFDPRFFLFNEEVDLAWRMWAAAWSVELCPEATFVHVGGSATRRNWPTLYREQVRGHLLFLAKHQGLDTAEGARRYLARILRVRALIAHGDERLAYANAARWLSSGYAKALLEDRGCTTPDRTEAPGAQTSGNDH